MIYLPIHDICIWLICLCPSSKIIWLYICLEFFNFVYITLELNILFNNAEHPKELVPYYMLPLFTILKSPYPISQLDYLEKIVAVWEKSCLVSKTWASKTPTSSLPHRSDHKDYENYKNLLKFNKLPAKLL